MKKEEVVKFRINDVASFEFLQKFCSNIGLGGLHLGYIEEELDKLQTSEKSKTLVVDILTKLQKLIDPTSGQLELAADTPAQQLYTELMIALQSEDIKLSKHIATNNLSAMYKALFDNELDLTSIIFDALAPEEMYSDKPEVSPMGDCPSRFEVLLGQKTVGIHTETGSKHKMYGLGHPESMFDKVVNGVIGYNYAPQLYNNIPYVYKETMRGPQRLRIGTQISQQRHMGVLYTNVPQSFLNFITASGGEHLYINLQKRNDGYSVGSVSERAYEHERSEALHQMEQSHPGAIVVTLPADNSDFFLKGFDKHHGHPLVTGNTKKDLDTANNIFEEIVENIFQNKGDVYLSDAVKKRLFGGTSKDNIAEGIKAIYGKTIMEVISKDANPDQPISMAQRQAILFHFFKHNFTQFLIGTLKPSTYNISCKDAIDRAGVHNLWNIMCKKIENGESMSVREFEKLLNIPAILVKDRPINDHIHLITNALGHYYYNLPKDQQALLPWAPAWIEQHSCYKNKSELAYTWDARKDPALKVFKEIHSHNFSPLYCAVSEGNLPEVKKIILESDKKTLDFWDGPQKSDTILLSAARNGRFEVFKEIIRLHDEEKLFSGIRSQHPENFGTALNYLFAHLAFDDIDNESTMSSDSKTQSNMTFECIEAYLQSMVCNASWSVKFTDYTSVKDERGYTPIDYLALTGDVRILDNIADFKYTNYRGTYTFPHLFNLRGGEKGGKTAMEIAAEHGHVDFVTMLWKLDNKNHYVEKEFLRCLEIAENVQSLQTKEVSRSLVKQPRRTMRYYSDSSASRQSHGASSSSSSSSGPSIKKDKPSL